VFSVVEDTINYYLEDGERYSGEVHLHNGEYYTGLTQTQSSQPLIRRTIQSDRPIIDFHAAVPAIAQVFFSDLIPTGITSNVLDTSIVRLARILSTDVELSARLSARLTNAAGIPSTPVGIIRATNVQSAIEELEEEKLNAAYNLSDVMDAAVAQANLGLGSAARENRDAFASASHQHPAHQDIDWMTEPPGASVLNLTNAPNSVGGYPRKWVIISIEAENYVIPAWKII
jgi:hypothetical protein